MGTRRIRPRGVTVYFRTDLVGTLSAGTKRGRLVPNVRFWTRRLAWATRPSALRQADERENQTAGAGRGLLD